MEVTTVEIAAQLQQRIADHARACYAEEACGILIGRVDQAAVRVMRVLPCPNQAPPAERRRRFEIDPRAVLNLQRALRATNDRLVGFYHSHPDGAAAPSPWDAEHIRLWPETVWLIASVGSDQPDLRAWWLDVDAGNAIRELRSATTRTAAPVCI